MIVPDKFGRKNRNFRKRLSDSLEGSQETQEGGDSLTQDTGPLSSLPHPAPNPVRRIPLTFHTQDDSDDEDTVEPVRLKRSSHSRKMTKEGLFSQRSAPLSDRDTSNATGSFEIASSHPEPDPAPRDEGVARSEELTKLRSSVQIGIIPDANAIHLAKKQREIARRKQEQETISQLPTFIPINKRTTIQESQVEKPQHNSRLIREEMDVDLSEEDESLTLNHNSNKGRTMRISYNQELSSEEDDEVKRWEEEQMMKGVTAGVVTDECPGIINHQGKHFPSAESSKLRYSDNGDVSGESGRVFSRNLEHLRDEGGIESCKDPPGPISDVSVQSMLQAVRTQHGELEEANSFTEMQYDRNLKTTLATEESLISSKQRLDNEKENYRFFHEIGDYVHDLLECIGEKTVIIDRMESQIIGIRSEIAEHIFENRKQVLLERDRLSRQDILIPHSAYQSDVQLDLMTEDERNNLKELYASYEKKKTDVLQESAGLFSDAMEEYSSADRIIQRFETWRLNHTESYQQSYIPLFLPKILANYARLELLEWDPISSEGPSWKLHKWYVSLLPISNPENDLLSSLVEQALIPLLTQTVSSVWDPMSASQTRMLALCILQINNEFPNLDRNKPMQSLYQTVTKKFVAATQGFYMPMFSKDHLEKNSEADSLLSYQFWLGVQLGTNISLWAGLLPEHTLVELILDGLLNRFLTLALHQFSDLLQSVEKCAKIVDFLPDCVKRGTHHSEVGALVRYMCWLVEALDRESMAGPDFIKKRARDGILELISLVRCLASQQATNLVQQFVNK